MKCSFSKINTAASSVVNGDGIITPYLAKKQFIINHFFSPKTHAKPPVSNTPFVGYALAYNKHLRAAMPDIDNASQPQSRPQSQQQQHTPTSISLPSSCANPFACFMNVTNSTNYTNVASSNSNESESDSYMMAFDGCSKGNPGRAGAGAVIYCNRAEIWADAKFVGAKETNNVAEYAGLIMGLHEALRRNIKQLTVQGDSELIIKQMKKEYAVKSPNIKAYYEAAAALAAKFERVHFKHVYRNHNVRADALSNVGIELMPGDK
jgi:ribonuclease HI